MRKPRIEIRVLCVLQKAKLHIQFAVFSSYYKYFTSYTIKMFSNKARAKNGYATEKLAYENCC